jgi:hypothetical protein
MTAPWARAVLDGRPPSPVVLVLGGFLTSPPMYRALAGRLRERGAADVVIGNVWTMDWLLAACRGLGPVLTRSGRSLLEASARSRVLADGAPVLLIGHSAGGMSARLLTSPEPFAGRRLNGSGRIGAIVTLGTPHAVGERATSRNRVGREAAVFAARVVPGAAWAPATGYLAVASRRVVGRRTGTRRERWTWGVYRELVPGPSQDVIEGDGLIPVASALLPGVRHLLLDDAAHGQGYGREWYGDDRFLDAWWPLALETWRSALHARAWAGAGSVASPAPPPPAFDGIPDPR